VDLGGAIGTGPPNPVGILGQVWVAVDRSASPRSGWVYALASVATHGDPMDVHFVRSTDGGQTWSVPVRVNDDPAHDALQWFGTMSVSPDGRIDVIWNDTRGTGDSWKSALYYSYSTDGGFTWSGNEQVSPVWDSRLGWPHNDKIGDYYHMVSDSTGADLAWAATFNGEQDVYYVRITPPAALADGDAGHPILHPVIPNPFGASATMAFDLPPGGGSTRLIVVDATGRRIATLVDGSLDGGRHLARWNGTDEAGRAVATGIYLCRLEASGHVEMRRMILLR
jgi:flagellar hook capping protein FlgD